ncbi:carboxymuconolactone decarboxylase family protein [Streptomyces reniochalinae]|uniref:Carboxymuconolactone decarboxylase family protein n=1 Tax=Streptomyces reniochalinae TaxID=2250578 RepID=A0A367ECA6_9ACTN|nr:carboxymuconolactone decarboxylase family protein [Streptomyces reniochalinae]RCG14977.1 carboxymuconolactone decarboxylase family protein [Streptomyces reniochalinae]
MARLDMGSAAGEPYKALGRAQVALDTGPLDATVRELAKIRASQLNGCVFCVDLHTRQARRSGESQDRLDQLPVWEESELFTARERAALAYTEAVTRQVRVADALWQEVCERFPDEAERGHLVAQVALINAFNRLGVPLELRPARTPGGSQGA